MNADRFDELHEHYADGTLSPAERAEFLALLETAEGRARFVETASYEAALSEELRVGAAAAKKQSSRSLQRYVPVEEPADESRTLARIGALAAAAVIVILTMIFATSTKQQPPSPMVQRPPTPAPKFVLPEEATAPTPAPAPVPAPVPAPTPPAPEFVVPKPAVRREEPAPEIRKVEEPKGLPHAPKPEEPKPRESATFVATVETVSGTVSLETGKGVAAGSSLTTGRDSYMAIKYPDGSRIELAADTTLSKIQDGPQGKTLTLESGMIFVDAAKQPAGKPMVLTTAQAESTVIGTQFVLTASATSTRLDVREGRVKFTRLPQSVSSVIVTAGHYAVAGPAGDPSSKAGVSLWKAPTAGLQLWLRADAGIKLNGGAIAGWMDQSTAGNSAVQEKPAAQPQLVANGINGRPCVRFDGMDDYFVLPDGFADFRLGLTAFVVVRPAPGGAWSRFIDLDVGPACDNIVFGRKDTADKLGFWVYANSATKGKVEAPGAVVPNEVQSFCAHLNPAGKVTLYKNGAAVATGETTQPKSTSRKPNGIAKSNSGDPYFKGDLFEILLYNRGLTEAERVFIESYLNAKYLDASTPPATIRPADK